MYIIIIIIMVGQSYWLLLVPLQKYYGDNFVNMVLHRTSKNIIMVPYPKCISKIPW